MEANFQASLKTAKDPVGGPVPAYPRGKWLDEASGKTGSGKKFYHNVLSGDEFVAQPYSVAVITPVTMDDVAKQTKKGDVWDPGGELAVLISAGKDATVEFDKIHPTDVIEDDDAPDAIIDTLGAGRVHLGRSSESHHKGRRLGRLARTCSQRFQFLVPAPWQRVGSLDLHWEGRHGRVRR